MSQPYGKRRRGRCRVCEAEIVIYRGQWKHAAGQEPVAPHAPVDDEAETDRVRALMGVHGSFLSLHPAALAEAWPRCYEEVREEYEAWLTRREEELAAARRALTEVRSREDQGVLMTESELARAWGGGDG